MSPIFELAGKAYDAALALVYPQPCAVCGASVESRADGVACAKCWQSTPLLASTDTLCWKCGAFSRARVDDERKRSVRCGQCDDNAFTSARACGLYEGALRASILQLKREPHIAARVARLIFAASRREPLNDATLIIPVPLHSERERERGFNQADVLARALSRVSKLPVDEYSLLRRTHTTRHRAGMDEHARRESVAGVFAVRHTDKIKEARVLLVDDVFTTGATVSACAAALKDAGAAQVFVLTLARSQAIR